uniref:Uncharacterized protein n=1 Tax=Megaselia scalaris TaxID=36166 RepID=T1GSX1_MEGSC
MYQLSPILDPGKLPRLSGWRDEECDKAVAEKDPLYRKNGRGNTRPTKKVFKNRRSEIVKSARQQKRRFEKAQLEILEYIGIMQTNSTIMYTVSEKDF